MKIIIFKIQVNFIKKHYKLPPDTILSPEPRQPVFGFFRINFVLFLICVTWVLLILITPVLEPSGSVGFDDEGLVSRTEHFGQIETLQNPFGQVVYNSGDYMCHQKNSRSFFVFDNQMSYCARCFGIFLGMAIGAAISTFFYLEMKWWFIIGAIVPIGLDGGLQLITSYESNNLFRILTGSLTGIVTMLVVGLVAIEVSESFKMWLAFRKYDKDKKSNKIRGSKKRRHSE
jgi:uncharacterized membrane protein